MKFKPMLQTPERPSKADHPRPAQPVVVTIEKQAEGSLIVSVCQTIGGEGCPAQSVPPAALQLELTLLGLPLRQAFELAERALRGEAENYPLNVSHEKWQEICGTWLWRRSPGIPFGQQVTN
ncbi:MAG: hypothetical protein WBW33_27495 [Bryobacteraceae bacterium]